MTINKDHVKGFAALGVLAAAIAGFMAYPGNTGDQPENVATISNIDNGEIVVVASTEGDEPKAEKAMADTNEVVKEKASVQAPNDNDPSTPAGNMPVVEGEEMVITVTKDSE